jgi:hypothetical protein
MRERPNLACLLATNEEALAQANSVQPSTIEEVHWAIYYYM